MLLAAKAAGVKSQNALLQVKVPWGEIKGKLDDRREPEEDMITKVRDRVLRKVKIVKYKYAFNV